MGCSHSCKPAGSLAYAGDVLNQLLGSPGGMLQLMQRARLMWPVALHQHATGRTVAELQPGQQIALLRVTLRARHPI